MMVQAEAILAMDFQNQAELLIKSPNAQDKILLLSAYAERGQRYREIPNPYFGDQEAARNCYAVLQTCINNLARTMVASRKLVVLAASRRYRPITAWG
jgi:protein-tyrosine-phosphatase